MKLVVFQDYLRAGGTERQAVAIANEAARRGHEATFLTTRPGGYFKKELSAPHIALQPFDVFIDEWAPGLERTLRKLSPDIVLCMGQVANAKIPQLKKNFPAVKFVATVRTGRRLCRARLKAYAAADLVITNSFALQNVLEGMGIKMRVAVVGNGLLIEPARDDVARMLLRKKMGADDETIVVLCLQRLTPQKGQHYLMENFVCASQGLNAQLWIVGRGFFGWALRAYARVLDPERIKVMPPEFPPAYYYSAADLAATVSHEDALPNFLIEAHAFGLPGICEDYAGCGEAVISGITGYVSAVGDDAAYASALRQMLVSPPMRKFFGTNARSLSFRFSRGRQMGELMKILETLVRS
jgi:glycosyltransferase involved in cell wall biosynthesis